MNEEEQKRTPLSVAIITKDEEDRLSGCLNSVAFADEVLVVDSGSTDGTVELAKSFGAKVLIEAWRGYSAQKHYAVDACLRNWVLILDADERVPQETAQVIRRELATNDASISANGFRRKNYLHGKWIKHCGWWPDRIVRLVNRKDGSLDGRPVHEKWVTKGRVKELDAVIEHISFKNYSELLAKMENYSNLASKELFERNAKVNAITPILHGLWMFVRTYFLELGILDGFDGFVISTTNAGGSFLKYAKARERGVVNRKEG